MFQSELLKQWPWNKQVLVLFSLVYVLFWAVVAFCLFHQSSIFAIFSVSLLIPLGFYIFHYKKINKMITVLKGCISAQNGETAEGLVYLKGRLSPGITIMRDDLFILIPVTGRRTKLYFEKITAVKETKKVEMRYLFAKRVFTLETGKNKTVSFAVRESVGKRWSVLLTDRLTK